MKWPQTCWNGYLQQVTNLLAYAWTSSVPAYRRCTVQVYGHVTHTLKGGNGTWPSLWRKIATFPYVRIWYLHVSIQRISESEWQEMPSNIVARLWWWEHIQGVWKLRKVRSFGNTGASGYDGIVPNEVSTRDLYAFSIKSYLFRDNEILPLRNNPMQ